MRDLLKKIYINREMGCLSNMLTTRMFFFMSEVGMIPEYNLQTREYKIQIIEEFS